MKSIANYVNEAHLKKILKDTAGIGTEATRANILETLINREYLKRQGKQLISTAKGRELIQLLPASITNPATTALWEQTLDSIAQGEGCVTDFLDDQCDTLDGMLEQLAKMGAKHCPSETRSHPCPDCQKPMYRLQGKKEHWWRCSGYPACKTTFVDDKGKPKVPVASVRIDEPQFVVNRANIKPARGTPLNIFSAKN
jgi:DNA topoisomerase-3